MTLSGTWLVVGLGNPGPTYSGNRHNIGSMATDCLAANIGSGWRSHKARALVATGRLSGHSVILAKPSTFMNTSGGPVQALAQYFSVPAERVIAIHDELDLPFAALRLKFGAGEGGHNGLRSISSALGTRDYYRIRLGIGRPPGRQDPADFVLRDFSRVEREPLALLLEQTASAVEDLLTQGLATAQNLWHACTP